MNSSDARDALPDALRELSEYRYPVGVNPARLYVQGLAEGKSRSTGKESLGMLVSIGSADSIGWLRFPWHQLGPEGVRELRALVAKHYPSPASANLRLAALRGALRWCWLLEFIDRDAYERAKEAAGSVRGYAPLRGREVGHDELTALYGACAADPDQVAGTRDLAMLRLLFATAIRCAELVAIKLVDVDLEGVRQVDGERELAIEIVGKGHRRRVIYVVGRALETLERWISIRGRKPGALFTPLSHVGGRRARPLTGDAVRHVCRKRGAEAGLKRFNPHDARRTAAGELLDELDVVATSQYLGHAKVETTRRYDRRGARSGRRAARVLDGVESG